MRNPRGNPQNLKTPTPKQARINGSKGGKASAEAYKRRKTLAENMRTLLDMPVSTIKDWNALAKMGILPEEIDNSQLLVVALFKKAKRGDVNAFREIRAMIGEENIQSQEQLDKLDAVLEQIGGVI